MSVLAQLVSRIPGLDDYNDQVKQNAALTSQNVQQGAQFMTLQGAMEERAAKRAQLEREGVYRQRLAAAKTDEERAQIAMEAAGPTGVLSHLDKVSRDRATSEQARSRIMLQAQQFMETKRLRQAEIDRMTNNDTKRDAQRALNNEATAFRLQLQAEAARQSGAFGADTIMGFQPKEVPVPPTMVGPQSASPAASAVAENAGGPAGFSYRNRAGEIIRGEAPSGASAEQTIMSALGGKWAPPTAVAGTQDVSPAAAVVAQASGATPSAWAPPTAPVRPPVVAPLTRAQGGLAPDVPQAEVPQTVVPTPGNGVPGVRAAAALPPMPPEIGSTGSPRERRAEIAKWRAQQTNPSNAMGAATQTLGDFTKTGDEFLESLPIPNRALIKGLASYNIDPKTLSTKGGHREEQLKLALQYDPKYDQTEYENKNRAIKQFGSGKLGDNTRSLNVAIEHIDTLGRAADALKNGNFTPGNKVYNEVAVILGQTPPNTFEGIRDIVANEVIKGTIGNAGALADREGAAKKVLAQKSPDQLRELMNGWTELMGGQVKGLEKQYEGSTKLKDYRERYLTQRTRDAIALAESKATGAPSVDRRGEPRDAGKRVVVDFDK